MLSKIGWFVTYVLCVVIVSACSTSQSSSSEISDNTLLDPKTSSASEAKATEVLSSLAPPILLAGEARPNWTIEERMAHYRVPGVSVAVILDGKIAWAKAFGYADAAEQIPVTGETLFQAASISKPVTALAALQLVDAGLIDLDTPVNEYLTRWQIPSNVFTQEVPVTLRHLLSHTGGLTVHGFPGYPEGDPLPTAIEVLNGASPANTNAVVVDQFPGLVHRYSGGGYTIAQVMLEDVSGESFEELLDWLVLKPANMSVSSFRQPLPVLKAPIASAAHDAEGNKVDGHSHRYPELAAAGLWTTPTDLANLAIAIANGGNDGEQMLSEQMLVEMMTPLGGSDYGLGFGVHQYGDQQVLSHTGGNHGFRAVFSFHPEGNYGVAIMTNSDRGDSVARELQSALAETYGWPAGASEIRDTADLSEAELGRFVGRYVGDFGGEMHQVVISVIDGGLSLESDLGIKPHAVFMSPDQRSIFNRNGGTIRFSYVDGELRGLYLYGVKFNKAE
ncbi:MAG: serine hydrolase domain-containing protein [Pseudomonadota bacterium]